MNRYTVTYKETTTRTRQVFAGNSKQAVTKALRKSHKKYKNIEVLSVWEHADEHDDYFIQEAS